MSEIPDIASDGKALHRKGAERNLGPWDRVEPLHRDVELVDGALLAEGVTLGEPR